MMPSAWLRTHRGPLSSSVPATLLVFLSLLVLSERAAAAGTCNYLGTGGLFNAGPAVSQYRQSYAAGAFLQCAVMACPYDSPCRDQPIAYGAIAPTSISCAGSDKVNVVCGGAAYNFSCRADGLVQYYFPTVPVVSMVCGPAPNPTVSSTDGISNSCRDNAICDDGTGPLTWKKVWPAAGTTMTLPEFVMVWISLWLALCLIITVYMRLLHHPASFKYRQATKPDTIWATFQWHMRVIPRTNFGEYLSSSSSAQEILNHQPTTTVTTYRQGTHEWTETHQPMNILGIIVGIVGLLLYAVDITTIILTTILAPIGWIWTYLRDKLGSRREQAQVSSSIKTENDAGAA